MIEKIIEQLQETGKCVIDFKNLNSVLSQLEIRGYTSRIESTDRDYLVLVERKYTLENLSIDIQESLINDKTMSEVEDLYWKWFDESGNIIGNRLPF
jgi:hypothetical protein